MYVFKCDGMSAFMYVCVFYMFMYVCVFYSVACVYK